MKTIKNDFLFKLFSNITVDKNGIKFDITPTKFNCLQEYEEILQQLMNKETRIKAQTLGFSHVLGFLEEEVVISIRNIKNDCDVKQEIYDCITFDNELLERVNRARIALNIEPLSLSFQTKP